MFKGFPTQKSKMSQGEEEGGGGGNEVHLGLPCGRQKSLICRDRKINCPASAPSQRPLRLCLAHASESTNKHGLNFICFA